jgi:hypothetical protein
MPRIRETARKLLLAPILCAAVMVVSLPADATDVAPNQLGQRMSGGHAALQPAGNPPDNAGPPAGAGSGKKIR